MNNIPKYINMDMKTLVITAIKLLLIKCSIPMQIINIINEEIIQFFDIFITFIKSISFLTKYISIIATISSEIVVEIAVPMDCHKFIKIIFPAS